MKLRVTQLRLEAEGVISVVLRSPAGERLPAWTPGAHIAITLGSGLVRQYSLCGAHDDPYSYTIAVLLVADGRGGSREVHQQLRVGEVLEVGEPRNNFTLTPAPGYLFLAGGIGITPILAMMESLQAQADPPPMRLIYGGRTRAAMAYLDRLGTLPDIALLPEDESGRPDIAELFAAGAAGTHVYCCGPPAMLAAVQRVSEERPDLALHIERFSASETDTTGPDDGVNDDGTFEVELARSGVTVTVGAGVSVLDAVLAAVPDTPYSCAAGFCGTCETKVLAGDVDHRDDLLTESEQQENSTMMICVSRSRGGAKLSLDL